MQYVRQAWQKVYFAAQKTHDGAPMQKGRLGKVDAQTGCLQGIQKYCRAYAERVKGKALVELKTEIRAMRRVCR